MYAKLINGELIPAPNKIEKDGMLIVNPKGDLLKQLGYKEVVYPSVEEDITTGYMETIIPRTPIYSEESECIKVTFIEDNDYALQEARNKMILLINDYDKSEAVNSFIINGIYMWLDKSTRTSLAYTLSVEKESGKDTTTLWYESHLPMSFVLPIVKLEEMLSLLEIYAKKTYDVTQQHKLDIYQLTNIEDILSYDYKSGYPEKLTF